ncbi:MAG TPA: polysaccharide deacetylase family protein, partial [Anaerolineaceae bacterium]|nr:polysaccharide deacetylase family protein [Anaerolineaceae bacterium]
MQVPSETPSPFPAETNTPVPPTPTSTPTLPPLPEIFHPKSLLTDVEPVRYLSDSCQYLADRWGEGKAEPGTIVAPIMFHSISKPGRPILQNTTINATYFNQIVARAAFLGFKTITIPQLVEFLKHNTWIPPRSMILIIDDRRPGTVREYFLPVLEKHDWTVTLAYISGTVPATEWKDLEDMAQTGRLDVQSHGWLHNADTYFNANTPEDIIHQEIFNPIDTLKEHFGYRPTAFIWPGGDFTPHTVEVAREAGYEVGFTVYSRGPVMYNWIPLGKPEESVNDPLMVLPRFWSPAAIPNLNSAVQVGEEA